MAVAYSGGRDSTALLHATLAGAEPLGILTLALHVHHGLSEHADAWLDHCEDRCRRWSMRGRPIVFMSRRVSERPERGESVEAWARQARYRALRQMALQAGTDLVLLAHHRRDQAETFLLQALRGGGMAGLSGMPRSARRDGITWSRPWLDVPHDRVDAYMRRHRLRWIDDDSDADARFARNLLRTRVWPALVAAFPDAEHALATAATWAQQAADVIGAVAAADLEAVADDTGLAIVAWRALPQARQAHALRSWLRKQGRAAPAAGLVERLLDEVDAGSTLRWPLPKGELRSYRGRLRYFPSMALGTGDRLALEPTTIDLARIGVHDLPVWGGSFLVTRVDAGGLPLALAGGLELRRRLPADRFQSGPGRPPRRLKLQYQAAGIAEQQRLGPILCSETALVFVAGLGIDARFVALPGQAQVSIAWRAA